jgi:hypothetical protein
MSYHQSWKAKVDPAFDQVIKLYVQFINVIGIGTNNGWIGLEDKALKLWEKKGLKGWVKEYEKEMTTEKNTVIKWKISRNISDEERKKARRDFESSVLDEMKALPEDSQVYYKKVFAPFYSETIGDNFFRKKTIAELKEALTDLLTNSYFLAVHRAMIEMKDESMSSAPEVLEKKYFRPSLIIEILLGIYNSISLLVFEKTYSDLLKEARAGESKSFFKLLQIDRTVIECEWAQKMIRQAQLSGDTKFFKGMAKGISKTPLDNDKEYTTARLVILIFWQFGLRKLEYDEILELLESCGVKLQESPEAFERFVRRLTENTRKQSIVSFNSPNKSLK